MAHGVWRMWHLTSDIWYLEDVQREGPGGVVRSHQGGNQETRNRARPRRGTGTCAKTKIGGDAGEAPETLTWTFERITARRKATAALPKIALSVSLSPSFSLPFFLSRDAIKLAPLRPASTAHSPGYRRLVARSAPEWRGRFRDGGFAGTRTSGTTPSPRRRAAEMVTYPPSYQKST